MSHALSLCLMSQALPETRDARDLRWSALMAAAQAGDGAAYAALLRECLPLLRAICRARLQNPAEVEDAVQDALLTLHRVRHTYDPARPFRPWLAAIAERRALDRGRRLGRAGARETVLDDALELGAEGNAEERMAASQLRDAVAELSPAQRTALRLTKIEQLSLQEASARSGMSVGALKVATHRALHALRKRMGGGA
jgi:RNA polymerase sigma-70 factor (ECF subfamily)